MEVPVSSVEGPRGIREDMKEVAVLPLRAPLLVEQTCKCEGTTVIA